MDTNKIMGDYDDLIKSIPEPEPPKCHFTYMDFEYGESCVYGNTMHWYECKHCGCVKDMDGNVIDQETGELKSPNVPKSEDG